MSKGERTKSARGSGEKSASDLPNQHSRREREIMDALYRLEKASAAEIREQMPGSSYLYRHPHPSLDLERRPCAPRKRRHRYIYEPLIAREQMGRRAIDSLLQTFFDNSVERAVTALLTRQDANIPHADLDRLARLIDKARKEGR